MKNYYEKKLEKGDIINNTKDIFEEWENNFEKIFILMTQ